MSDAPIQTAVILTAAGTSSRFEKGQKKEFIPLYSKLFPSQVIGTVLSCSAEPFLQFLSATPLFTLCNLIITVPLGNTAQNIDRATKALFSSTFVTETLSKMGIVPEFVSGGSTRQESVFHALEYLDCARDSQKLLPHIVLIHDAARPFTSATIVEHVLELAAQKGAAVATIPPVDTQKEIGSDGAIVRHLDRSTLVAVQTPQGFLFAPLFDAHAKAMGDGKPYTDDTEIWGRYAGQVYTCEGSVDNKKLTYQSDLEQYMNYSTTFRTGLGYDLHRLVKGRALILGGITIPFEKGELGHSDGDVLLHAITDAVLGAAALGDIGELFPPSDTTWKDANSAQLLQTAWLKVKDAGWELENLDCVLALEKPKFLPWREQVRSSIATILDCEENRVFVKAKTGEGLGEIGRGEAVSAWVSCLLQKK